MVLTCYMNNCLYSSFAAELARNKVFVVQLIRAKEQWIPTSSSLAQSKQNLPKGFAVNASTIKMGIFVIFRKKRTKTISQF